MVCMCVGNGGGVTTVLIHEALMKDYVSSLTVFPEPFTLY